MTPEDVGQLMSCLQELFRKQDWDAEEMTRWARVLKRVNAKFATAEEAAENLLARQAFIEPHELVGEIKRIHKQRQDRQPVYQVPDGGSDAAYHPQLQKLIRGISDGGRGLARTIHAIEAPVAEESTSEASVQARALVHDQSPEFIRMRDKALEYRCRRCQADMGHLCVNTITGQPLTMAPAHEERLVDAELIAAPRQLTQQESLELLAARMNGGAFEG